MGILPPRPDEALEATKGRPGEPTPGRPAVSDLPETGLILRARRLWRERRLDVGSLRLEVRWLVLAGLAVCALGALLIVLIGNGVRLPGGRQQLSGFTIPRLVLPFCYIGLAVSSGCIAAAASRRGGVWRVVALLGVALLATATGATIVNADRLISPVPAFVPATGWAIVSLGLSLPLTQLAPSRERRWLVPVVAVMPFALALLVYATWGGRVLLLSPVQFLHRDVLGYQLVTLIGALHIAFVVLVVWTALESAAAARDIASIAVRVLRPFPAVVGGLLLGKLIWLAFGYAEALPVRLGGPVAAWKASRRCSRAPRPSGWLDPPERPSPARIGISRRGHWPQA